MAKKKKVAPCDCADRVNEGLKEHNVRLTRNMIFDLGKGSAWTGPPLLLIEKIDSKNKKPKPEFPCKYCPFCGQKYESEV